MDKIIFLNPTGTIVSVKYLEYLNGVHSEDKKKYFSLVKKTLKIDPECSDLLRWIIETTGAEIVLLNESEKTRAYLKKNIKIFDVLDVINIKNNELRGLAIEKWIKKQQDPLIKYVVIDSLFDFENKGDFFIFQKVFTTDPHCGLTPTVSTKIIKFLE